MACEPDRDGAIREVAKAYEFIKSYQPRLQFCDDHQLSATTNLAQSLLNEALRALHLALFVMNSESPGSGGAESSSRSNMPHVFSPMSAAGHAGGIPTQQRKGKRRRSTEETSRVILTDRPHDDGYVWRKYGEKKINGTHFTRNYFRCSYKYDSGCQATKQIQQQSSNDLPMFQVTYSSEHTCNCTITTNEYINADLPQLSYRNPNGTSSPMVDNVIKHEQEGLLLPPLAEASTVLLDSMSCQEPLVLSDPYNLSPNHDGYHMTSTNDCASFFPCGSTDGYIELAQMVLPPEPLEDNPFNDAELDLLYNSLIYNK
ncbi:unnamed protein product [Urochloa decumbens]|uniref:WRKY domain-containing protein n=1 Tax=Urochloa decumbens TaxID=240449 RepID=A0ABC9B8L2_9POAL